MKTKSWIASITVMSGLFTAKAQAHAGVHGAGVAAGMALVGAFALFHGHAHGAEMPATANARLYALGFVLSTALLHAVGLGAGLAIKAGLMRLGGVGTGVRRPVDAGRNLAS